MVFRGLRKLGSGSCPAAIPAPVYDELRKKSAQLAQRSLGLARELAVLSGTFREAGIVAIPLKGAALSMALYADAGARTSIDLDFLIGADDLLRARDLLFRQRFTMTSAVHWPCDSAYRRSINAEFSVQRGGLSVDLHWQAFPVYFPFALDSGSMIRGATVQQFAGREIPALSPEHQLLYLAGHGAKHQWEKLQWSCDFARFVDVAAIDWEKARDLCQAAGSIRVLGHGLALARILYGTELPAQAACLIDARSQELAETVASRITTRDGARPGAWENAAFFAKLSNSVAAKARVAGGLLFSPTEAEWELVRLPVPLYPLYYPVRIARLSWKHLTGALRA